MRFVFLSATSHALALMMNGVYSSSMQTNTVDRDEKSPSNRNIFNHATVKLTLNSNALKFLNALNDDDLCEKDTNTTTAPSPLESSVPSGSQSHSPSVSLAPSGSHNPSMSLQPSGTNSPSMSSAPSEFSSEPSVSVSSAPSESHDTSSHSPSITSDTLSCPSLSTDDATLVPSEVSMNFVMSSEDDTLCTLTYKTFSGGREMLIPIGRSYNGNPWEAVAGPVQLSFDCTGGNICSTHIPANLDSVEDATFQLLTFKVSDSRASLK
eukprot:CAMPEP_0178940348 /NCGR_PEP_ID=MMETSP0789-20121207/759_1 /TAXON_ID=3005 /ORGANISM="Rhizosolenia setigera, Strain CCMP 1694" /LENGTH=265 /DNA_ID=CAMNT_0020619377 /DNA_START=15 /DNA_END=809 /DNA_ORIENTATION=+